MIWGKGRKPLIAKNFLTDSLYWRERGSKKKERKKKKKKKKKKEKEKKKKKKKRKDRDSGILRH